MLKKGLFILLAFAAVFFYFFPVYINQSASLPYTLFISLPKTRLEKEDYVVFFHPSFAKKKLVKQAKALANDIVSIEGNVLLINDKTFTLAASLKPRSCAILNGSRIIPEGCFFAYASHPDSFDSRFEDFGFIELDQIESIVYPLY